MSRVAQVCALHCFRPRPIITAPSEVVLAVIAGRHILGRIISPGIAWRYDQCLVRYAEEFTKPRPDSSVSGVIFPLKSGIWSRKR